MKMKTLIRKDMCTSMFTAALFAIPKIVKQPKGPSTDEWIKMWYIFTMEYYSVTENNESVINSYMDVIRNYHTK